MEHAHGKIRPHGVRIGNDVDHYVCMGHEKMVWEGGDDRLPWG